jgi:3-hydroxybutyryl-CoA dehydrogenase
MTPMSSEIGVREVGIIGAGQMGAGIAEVAAASGYSVRLYDSQAAALTAGLAKIEDNLARLAARGKLTPETAAAVQERITPATTLEAAAAGADYIFEAAPEILELKQDLFASLERLAPDHAILATNTSQLSPTAIAARTACADRVLAMHWFNPPPVMRLIEVMPGRQTSAETVRTSVLFAESMGKEVVVLKTDSPGYIVSRLLLAQRAEALRVLEEGVASVEDIDRAIELGLHHPMGPFRLADFTGLDTALRNLQYMSAELGERFAPTEALRRLAEAGRLGRKSGEGFYRYDADGSDS